uniref:Uncharacterized protein n=1 Tax=Theropithecus gelada TaxID=9565 RepID=A0A8D2EHM4_THEGE
MVVNMINLRKYKEEVIMKPLDLKNLDLAVPYFADVISMKEECSWIYLGKHPEIFSFRKKTLETENSIVYMEE